MCDVLLDDAKVLEDMVGILVQSCAIAIPAVVAAVFAEICPILVIVQHGAVADTAVIVRHLDLLVQGSTSDQDAAFLKSKLAEDVKHHKFIHQHCGDRKNGDLAENGPSIAKEVAIWPTGTLG